MEFCIWSAFLTLLIFFPVADFTESWTYTKSPESVTVPLGDEVVFTCQTNITAERVVWWHRQPNQHGKTSQWTEIRPGSVRNLSAHRVIAKPNLSMLTVNLKDESLAGEYRCVSWFGASGLASVVANLTVAKLYHITSHDRDRKIVVPPDANILIRCPPPISEPPANMLYYRNFNGKSELVEGEMDSEGAIMIRTRLGPPSTYTCVATNLFVNKSYTLRHNITVEVKKKTMEAPTFTQDMVTRITAKEGESITIGCSAIGFPAPRVTWRKIGGSLSQKHPTNLLLLEISHIQLHDQGDYLCNAVNEAGSSERIVHVQVVQPPQITPEEYNETVPEGGIVHLSCGRVSGIPRPSLNWLINGVDVSHDRSVKVLENTLEINPVEKRHAGLIQCFATNYLGSAFTANLLQVIPKQHMSQHDVNEADQFGISNDNPKRHKSKFHKGNDMVPPSRPNITRLSDESVMVRWSVQKGGLPIKFFKIQYRDFNTTMLKNHDKSSLWMTITDEIEPHIKSYAVDGLIPEHVYRFRVAAVYSNDDNKKSFNSVRFLLQRGAEYIKVPQTPIFTKAEATSPHEILLHWRLPLNASDDIPEPDGFYVYYRRATTIAEYNKAAVEGGGIRSQLLNHLQPDTAYEIKLQSFTPMAASDFSAIITERTKPSVKKVVETSSPPSVSSGAASNNMRTYGIVGGSVGVVALLIVVISSVVFCKKRKGATNEKQDNNITGNGGTRGKTSTEGVNGYLSTGQNASGKPTITITPNPMHPEGENIDVEMSYISAQNNNCSVTPPHRNSSEHPTTIPSSCREELRKQMPMTAAAAPARENYV